MERTSMSSRFSTRKMNCADAFYCATRGQRYNCRTCSEKARKKNQSNLRMQTKTW
jgi:hypothetical protein